jgi:hypothetical protein
MALVLAMEQAWALVLANVTEGWMAEARACSAVQGDGPRIPPA